MARRSRKPKLADLPGQPDPTSDLDSALFLAVAAPVLESLKADLLARAKGSEAVTRALEARHEAEKKARRTADAFVAWQGRFIEQVAAAWLLSCVFVRTLEDRGLIGQPRLAGAGAMDSQRLFFEMAPSLSERDYLRVVFRELCRFSATEPLFDAQHNPVWLLSPSAEAAKSLLALFRSPDPDTPAFRFGQTDTRFLGDLYQDLDEGVRKRFALLQTPRFVESYILDKTLDRAIDRFGLSDTTLIDPTCGSGHFLLGAFERLYERHREAEPGLSEARAAHQALDQVYGADINPYAVAIARFRLTLAYLDTAGYDRLRNSPKLPLHLAVADSLLHNPQLEQTDFSQLEGQSAGEWGGDMYALDDEEAARDVLHRRYAAVVGNPPYITVKDKVLRDRYRNMYTSAAGKYALSAPFTERFFLLARDRGAVGMINADSFLQREFGKALIEQVLPQWNLDRIVDTSGAHLPGHSSTTVMLFGTHEAPADNTILVVQGKRQEGKTPAVPAKGRVWSSITEHGHEIGFENDFISVASVPRERMYHHPWNLAGGGVSELKTLLEESANITLGDIAVSIGISCVTGEDAVYVLPPEAATRRNVGRTRSLVIGEQIRDWSIDACDWCVFPYDDDLELLPESELERELRHLWSYRSVIMRRKRFGVPMTERGLSWYELQELYDDKLRTKLTVAFAFVVSHNHFILDRGGKVFKQSAPIIKLPDDATEDDHLALLAYLNSSTACFWMKQVCYNKGSSEHYTAIREDDVVSLSVERGTTGGGGNFEFAGTAIKALPIATTSQMVPLAARATSCGETIPSAADSLAAADVTSASDIEAEQGQWQAGVEEAIAELVCLQEDMDWGTYAVLGLTEHTGSCPTGERCPAGGRPYELYLARKHGEKDLPVVGVDGHLHHREPPGSLSAAAHDVWKRRLELLENSKVLQLLESFPYKRRWRPRDLNREWMEACRAALADQLEQALEASVEVRTARATLNEALSEAKPRAIAEFLANDATRADAVGREVLAEHSVPFLSAFRFKLSGVEKHFAWQQTWDLQRREDAGEDVGEIPVPPKYKSTDYRSSTIWRLRGKLDVPKERFISYPGCESDEDGEPLYGWAGWNHLEQAQALAALYQERKNDGWQADRLTPMLAGLLELVPWVKQWHNDPSEEYGGLKLGGYFESFVAGECSALALTENDLRNWRPPETRSRRRT